MFELPLPEVLTGEYAFDTSSLADFDLFKQLTQALSLPQGERNEELLRVVRGEPKPKRVMVEEHPPTPKKREVKAMHKSPSPAVIDTRPSPVEMEVEPQPEPEPVREAPVRGEHTVDGLLDHRVHFLFNVDGLKSMVYDFNSGQYTM